MTSRFLVSLAMTVAEIWCVWGKGCAGTGWKGLFQPKRLAPPTSNGLLGGWGLREDRPLADTGHHPLGLPEKIRDAQLDIAWEVLILKVICCLSEFKFNCSVF